MSELVLYQPGGGAITASPPPPAPSSSSPAITAGGQNVRAPGWGVVAFLSLLALAILTVWRVHTGRLAKSTTGVTTTATKTIWSAVVLAILISLVADFSKGLGAAFGFAVVLFILLRQVGPFTATGAATGPLATAAGAAIASPGTALPSSSSLSPSSSSGTSSIPTCPAGQLAVILNGAWTCTPIGQAQAN